MTRVMKYFLLVIYTVGVIWVDGITVQASEQDTGLATEPLIVVDSYEISGERIVPGNEFTLSLTLKNYSNKQTARDVLIDIQNPSGVAPVYGTLSQAFLGDVGPGDTKTVSFQYDSSTTVTSETVDFNITIVSSANTNYITLRAPSGTDAPFSIMSMNFPSGAYIGESNSVSLTFEVLGDKSVSDVAFTLECNGEVIGTSQAGSIMAGTTKTQSASIVFTDAGEYTVDFYLYYMDDDGQKKNIYLGSRIIEVKENNTQFDKQTQENQTNQETSEHYTALILGCSGVLILLIFLAIAVIIRKNK